MRNWRGLTISERRYSLCFHDFNWFHDYSTLAIELSDDDRVYRAVAPPAMVTTEGPASDPPDRQLLVAITRDHELMDRQLDARSATTRPRHRQRSARNAPRLVESLDPIANSGPRTTQHSLRNCVHPCHRAHPGHEQSGRITH